MPFKSCHANGLNEHVRFLRYGQGHYFAPHQDGENRNGNGRSLFSALLYLSDSTDGCGGTTRFVAPQCPEVARCGRCDWSCDHCVDAPVAAGDMVIFTQTLLHAGTEPKSNEKF
ncbi:Fe2OG dioxygenase domain-containing protein, partial [Durusdinium trenchii]